MDTIIKDRWAYLLFCVLLFIAFTHYVEDINTYRWLFFAFMFVFLFFSFVVAANIYMTELIARKKFNKFIIILFFLLFSLLAGDVCLIMLHYNVPISKIYLLLYQISFSCLCILMVLPIIKMPHSSEGIITTDDRPIKKKWVSLISLYRLNSLPREFQTDYIVRKMFNNKVSIEQKFNVKAEFSSLFFEKIRDTKIIYLDQIIKVIEIQTECMIGQNNFNRSAIIFRSSDSYFAEGEITVTYLT